LVTLLIVFLKNPVFFFSPRFYQLNQRGVHYLSEANPVRQPKDIVTCVLNNTIHHDEQIVVFNKPPGVMVLGMNNIYFHIRF
jgi:23S rRNA-/tRNA-specific pseudouridylate synthase